jgi:hypothetical protein
VEAAQHRSESNDQTERQVTKLKFIKRSITDIVGECLANSKQSSKT